MNYSIMIGIETHLQVLTDTKMYCGCKNEFHAEPNTLTCPVCLGEPGALPVINEEVYRKAVMAGLALNCDIQEDTRFDRKNYFYPDLPKGYQITQFYYPFALNGYIEIETDAGKKQVELERIHIEEDSGKLTHQEELGESWIDYNRSGVPLIEIVSRPQMTSADEAYAYLSELRLMMRHIGTSDCEMQEGSLRTDINFNVLVKTENGTEKTPIVEIKNMNSFSQVKACIEYETKRHLEEFVNNPDFRMGQHAKETRGWDDVKQVTNLQRQKEGLADYRYFPEPDLPPYRITQEFIDSLPRVERPKECHQRLVDELGLDSKAVMELISEGKDMVDAFEYMATSHDPRVSLNILLNETLEALNEKHSKIKDLGVSLDEIGDLVDRIARKDFAMRLARKVFKYMVKNGVSAKEAVEKTGAVEVNDDGQLKSWCEEVVSENAKAVADYKGGKEAALNGLMGRVMQKSQGKANPGKVKEMLKEILDA